MAVASYGNSTQSSGVVRIVKDLEGPIQQKHILIVEDIIDSGLTLHYLVDLLQRRNPLSLRICSLLDKERDRVREVSVSYRGFTIPDKFVVGYGLDYAQRYRNLPYVGILKPFVYDGESKPEKRHQSVAEKSYITTQADKDRKSRQVWRLFHFTFLKNCYARISSNIDRFTNKSQLCRSVADIASSNAATSTRTP
jgi:hypothetical protein